MTRKDCAFLKTAGRELLQSAGKRRTAAVTRAMGEIGQLCRPLLAGLSGGIAYGLDDGKSDISIRGIFLNEREEWTGLREERESVSLSDADATLYGLRRAMELLLACDVEALELLGLRQQDLLCRTAEGQRILDASPAFLSRRAIFSFNAHAVKLRRQIQKRIDAGRVDRKALGEEMMHLIRVYDMGGELLETRCVRTYREHARGLLLRIRAGEYQNRHGMPTSDYDRLLEYYMGAFRAAALRTTLPPEPDYRRIKALTMEIAYKAL